MLVSAAQQSILVREIYMCIYMCVYIYIYVYVCVYMYIYIYFSKLFSVISYYKILNMVPCAIQ